MAVPSKILNAYQQIQSDLEATERYVSQTLRPWCDKRGYPFKGRRKDVESLSEKLESGRYQRWSAIDDLYACTVVIPTTAHENQVLDFLSQAFEEVEVRRRNSTQKPPDVFRFDSTRYVGRIRTYPGLGIPESVSEVNFEIQIPTAFEYAWTVVTHDLVYKSEDFDWRKGRIAALLKASVEQIELLTSGFEQNVALVPKSPHPESDAKREIVTAFKGLIQEGLISKELEPASWSRFADNFYALVRSYSGAYSAPDRAIELTEAAVRTMGETKEFSTIRSGSLFQVVLGLVHSGVVEKTHLSKFVVVDSVELRDIHKIDRVPKPFLFDKELPSQVT